MSEGKSKPMAAFWAFLAKIGAKVAPYLTKLLKFTKVLKFGLAAASFASYAYMFTWKFAILIMIALAWHESGHVWAMRQMGIKTKGFYFIPFLGGAAIAEESAKTYGIWTFVSIMGPVWGLALALVSCGLYYITGLPIFAAAASFMAMINLFNLFPVNPLDGGQIVRSIAFSIHKNLGFIFLSISIIASSVMMYKIRAGLFGFILILGLADLILEFFKRKSNNKKIAELTHNAKLEREFAELASNSELFADREHMHRANEGKLLSQIVTLKQKIPTSMNRIQLFYSVLAYGANVMLAIGIIKLMAHIPGANLVNEFLAEK